MSVYITKLTWEIGSMVHKLRELCTRAGNHHFQALIFIFIIIPNCFFIHYYCYHHFQALKTQTIYLVPFWISKLLEHNDGVEGERNCPGDTCIKIAIFNVNRDCRSSMSYLTIISYKRIKSSLKEWKENNLWSKITLRVMMTWIEKTKGRWEKGLAGVKVHLSNVPGILSIDCKIQK